jgi:hypothetical protein
MIFGDSRMRDTLFVFLLATLATNAPALAQDNDCGKLNEKDQAECYYDQADSLATDIVETVTEKCKELENKEPARAFCTAYGMAALLDEAKKWERKR